MPAPAWLLRPEGPVPYEAANDAMHRLAERRLAGDVPDTVVMLEHPPVFTAGRRSKTEDLRWSPAEVMARGGEVHRIDRGGAYTFHGPGQLVCYPIVDLGSMPDVGRYLRQLEEAVIRAAADLGIGLERRGDVQTGVWAGDEKVCAIGIRLMRARVALHGLALNCETDLSWFDGIVACGLPDHGVTSLSRVAGRRVTVAEVRPLLERHLGLALDRRLEPAPADELAAFRPEPVSRAAG